MTARVTVGEVYEHKYYKDISVLVIRVYDSTMVGYQYAKNGKVNNCRISDFLEVYCLRKPYSDGLENWI